jgi:hypothetical protein
MNNINNILLHKSDLKNSSVTKSRRLPRRFKIKVNKNRERDIC